MVLDGQARLTQQDFGVLDEHLRVSNKLSLGDSGVLCGKFRVLQ